MNVKTPIDLVSGTSIGKGHWRSFGSHSSPATSCIQEISLKTNHVCMKMQSPNQLNLLFFTHSDKIRLYHHLFKFFKCLLTKLRAYVPFGVWPSACPSKFTSHHCPILFCFNHLDSMIIRKLKGSRKKNEKNVGLQGKNRTPSIVMRKRYRETDSRKARELFINDVF